MGDKNKQWEQQKHNHQHHHHHHNDDDKQNADNKLLRQRANKPNEILDIFIVFGLEAIFKYFCTAVRAFSFKMGSVFIDSIECISFLGTIQMIKHYDFYLLMTVCKSFFFKCVNENLCDKWCKRSGKKMMKNTTRASRDVPIKCERWKYTFFIT